MVTKVPTGWISLSRRRSDVADDGVVLWVVPSEGDGVVGDDGGGKAGWLGWLRRSYIDKIGLPAEPDGVYRLHPVGVKHIGCHVVVGVLGSSTSCVIYVDQEGALSLGGPPAKYLVARNGVIVGGVPAEGHRAIPIGGARQVARFRLADLWALQRPLRQSPGWSASPRCRVIVKVTLTLMVLPSLASVRV